MTFVNLKKVNNENITGWQEGLGRRTRKPVNEAALGPDEKISICGGDKQHLVSVKISTKVTTEDTAEESKLIRKFCDVIDVKYLTKFLNQLKPGMTSEEIESIFVNCTKK